MFQLEPFQGGSVQIQFLWLICQVSLVLSSNFLGSFIQFPWFFLPAWPNSLSSHFATSHWWFGTGFYFLLLTPWYTILARVKQHHPLDAHYYSVVDEPQLS
jgi:hypothetical protein